MTDLGLLYEENFEDNFMQCSVYVVVLQLTTLLLWLILYQFISVSFVAISNVANYN